jgi:hypothetical protein
MQVAPTYHDDDKATGLPRTETSQERSNSQSSTYEADADPNFGSTDQHIFSDPAVADFWRRVYDGAKYENRHRFDPGFKWSAAEERKLLRKIDFRIILWAWVMFCALDLHRRNITRAISDNMLPEIGRSSRSAPRNKRSENLLGGHQLTEW